MIHKSFAFSRIQKTPEKIEEDINSFLKKHEFKFATQNESAIRGKFIVSLFANKGAGKVRARVFKDQYQEKLDIKITDFLNGKNVQLKFATQTFVGSNIYSIIYYEIKEEVVTPPTQTTPPAGANTNG